LAGKTFLHEFNMIFARKCQNFAWVRVPCPCLVVRLCHSAHIWLLSVRQWIHYMLEIQVWKMTFKHPSVRSAFLSPIPDAIAAWRAILAAFADFAHKPPSSLFSSRAFHIVAPKIWNSLPSTFWNVEHSPVSDVI